MQDTMPKQKDIEKGLKLAKLEQLADLGAKGTVQMGLSFLQADRLDRAAHYFDEAQHFIPACQDPETLSVVYFGLGQWALARDEESEAIELFEESLNFAINHKHLLTYQLAARVALAKITRAQGQIDRAEKAFKKIYQDALDGQLEVHSLEARLGLGLCAWRKGDPETAYLSSLKFVSQLRVIYFTLSFLPLLEKHGLMPYNRNGTKHKWHSFRLKPYVLMYLIGSVNLMSYDRLCENMLSIANVLTLFHKLTVYQTYHLVAVQLF